MKFILFENTQINEAWKIIKRGHQLDNTFLLNIYSVLGIMQGAKNKQIFSWNYILRAIFLTESYI